MNLLGCLVAFISPMAHAVSNIFDAYVSGSVFKRIPTTIFYVNLTNILGIICLPLFGSIHSLSPAAWLFVLLLSIINVGYQFPYFAALNKTDTSVVAALFQLEKVFIPLWAFLIVGEVLHPVQYAGFGIIILFSLLLNINPKANIKINTGFWLMCLTAIILSFDGAFYKALLGHTDWVSAAFWVAVISFVVQFMMVFYRPVRTDIVKNFGKYRKKFGMFLFLEFFDQIGSFSPIFALSLIPVLVDSGIQSVQPIFVALYGVILARFFGKRFHEDISRGAMIKKIVCFVMIGIGVMMTLIS
jgi:drug/metabolite transporter (DMT)-like permease